MKKYLLFSLLTLNVFAQSGEEIVRMVQDYNKSDTSEESQIVLFIKDGEKNIAERRMKAISIVAEGDIPSKLLLEFIQPVDVKGTKLLTWTYLKENKSQWIYLPSLKKTRRILAGSKNSSFMGSEFTYEDIGGQSLEKFTYDLVQVEEVPSDIVWHIREKSKDPLVKNWKILKVKKSLMNPVAIDYYNMRNEKVKSSKFQEYREYTLGRKKVFRPNLISMTNLLTGKESILKWEQREFGKKIAERDFNPNSLDVR